MKLALSAFLAVTLLASTSRADSRIINGVPVPPGHFSEVIQVDVNHAICTATVVGPRVVLTAAHCGRDGETAKFKVNGKQYEGEFFRHPGFPDKDIDIGLIVSRFDITGVSPAHVFAQVDVGQEVFLLGYGCSLAGGGGQDGLMRMGASTVTGYSENDFVSKRPDGGAFCFGDSGGPTFIKESGKYRVVGVASKGNLLDTNYSANLTQSFQFLFSTAEAEDVKICGLNSECDEVGVSGAPEFKEKVIKISVSTSLDLIIGLSKFLKQDVDGVRWTLDADAPKWLRLNGDILAISPDSSVQGEFRVSLMAQNSQGAAAAMLVLTVAPVVPGPKCTLTASPQFVKVGDGVTLSVTSDQPMTYLEIDGKKVPDGFTNIVVLPEKAGVYVAKALVVSETGKQVCTTRYAVK